MYIWNIDLDEQVKYFHFLQFMDSLISNLKGTDLIMPPDLPHASNTQSISRSTELLFTLTAWFSPLYLVSSKEQTWFVYCGVSDSAATQRNFTDLKV